MKLNMNQTRYAIIALFAAALGLLLAQPASADELGDLKDSFKARAAKLLELRDAGTVGETFDGWAALVKGGADKAVADFISAENADRKALYALIAAKQSIAADVVAERNAIRVFKSAAPDHYLKTKAGKWVQKKNVTIDD